ncbi:MAG: hypothetical protein HN712_13280 [Gemmatimonadetes bacterium]|jgi:hypothetical protein|nr:hypothetical protein [Gemmatimonadota bacterium]MBT6147317.1 hypothetical protein [Gemmatimonadota bacterium]MBT7861287.1 hypothetical protein [Gemmatimonadota bacterium]
MKTYWGDIHNHCAVSYGHGVPERVLDNARQHLDFVSITGHAFWPDMPTDITRYNHAILYHLGGFAKLQQRWDGLLDQLTAANRPGEFVTLPSYEWHSCEFGDYNAYFNTHQAPLIDGPDLATLAQRLGEQAAGFMLMPHHCGYSRGHRGLNWDGFMPAVSPLIEIYSNHGCGEADDASYEYHHTMGPRVGGSMVRRGLLAGHRFGFSAGTDSHDGYPGHYGHGKVGVITDKLDLPSIWDGLMNRRTIASTGTRFAVDYQLGGGSVGEVVRRQATMPLRFAVEGSAPIERVDLIEGANGRCRVRRLLGPDLDFDFAPGRYKIKVECGWGRADTRSDWDISCHVRGGRLLGLERCFRHSTYPMDEMASSEQVVEQDDARVRWQARAVPNPSGMVGGTHFNAGGTQAVVLEIEANSDCRLQVTTSGADLDLALSDLVVESVGQQIDGFGSPAIKVNRAIPERAFSFAHDEDFQPPTDAETGFCYARVIQSDGQMAWISPIWYE